MFGKGHQGQEEYSFLNLKKLSIYLQYPVKFLAGWGCMLFNEYMENNEQMYSPHLRSTVAQRDILGGSFSWAFYTVLVWMDHTSPTAVQTWKIWWWQLRSQTLWNKL